MLDIMQMIANRNKNKQDDHNTMLDSIAKTQLTGQKKIMEYPNSTLLQPHFIITIFFNLSCLTQGNLEKIRPERPTKFGRNDSGPKRPRPKRPGTIVIAAWMKPLLIIKLTVIFFKIYTRVFHKQNKLNCQNKNKPPLCEN